MGGQGAAIDPFPSYRPQRAANGATAANPFAAAAEPCAQQPFAQQPSGTLF